MQRRRKQKRKQPQQPPHSRLPQKLRQRPPENRQPRPQESQPQKQQMPQRKQIPIQAAAPEAVLRTAAHPHDNGESIRVRYFQQLLQRNIPWKI